MAPALVILAIGLNPSRTLVLSQVVLCFGIPFALIPLAALLPQPRADGHARQPALDDRPRGDRDRGVIVALNCFLLEQTFAPLVG